MPKEIFSPFQYQESSKYLTRSMKPLKQLENSASHSTTVYFIPDGKAISLQSCDYCGTPARFLIYDRDHMAQITITLYCQNCSNEIFERWVLEANL